ncbi:uncharacterized protein Triagg1_2331 [Trichoderma aggressivum f. europaeum]|uniref:NWD NACHT-NTPase N-terminal domain-containing protein n=1 Tax=Trichoderma aggressivum f. europaeum TaxID=173218 RepID=A0AAE1IKL8_9HYPO|nr:hypothetical protein Triagg1_2331 [Trichoderma aggressivum f. europaeum]
MSNRKPRAKNDKSSTETVSRDTWAWAQNAWKSMKRSREAGNHSAVEVNTNSASTVPQLTLSRDTAALAQVKREHLWDEAYDNLRLVHPQLVTQYEEILSLNIEAMDTQSSTSMAELTKTSISQTDLKVRWRQMCHLMNWWLDNRDRDSQKSNRFQDLIRDHIRKSAGGGLPNALAWVLLHPPSETEAICPGLLDIISRMNWYNYLPRLVAIGAPDVLLEEEQVLRRRVIDLYREVLSYLMNAVLPVGRALDPWEMSLTQMQLAEDNLFTFSGGLTAYQLDDFLVDAREDENRRLSPSVKKTMSLPSKMDEELACLGRVDTRSRIIEAQNENVLLVNELCQWICSTEQYKSVVDWSTADVTESDSSKDITNDLKSQILLIGGDPGLHTTALMEAIVQHLSNEANLEEPDVIEADSKAAPWVLSYYSCGSTSHGIDNSARVLRSLIHSLLQQQPKLITHLNEALQSAERDRFDSPKDFFALSGVFFRMLSDQSFVRSYLVVDGIDGCSSAHGRDCDEHLDDLIRLIKATEDVPHKIKWLLSANMNSRIKNELMKEGHFHLQYIILDDAFQTRKLAIISRRHIFFLIHQLAEQKRYLDKTQKEVSRLINEKSQGNILWAVIACAILRKKDSWHAVEALKEMPGSLDELYEYARVDLKRLPHQDPELCKSVLSIVAIVHRPLLISELGRLVELPSEVDPVAIIAKCPFLEVQSGIVKFVNPAARQNTRERLHHDLTELSETHALVARKTLEFLSAHFEAATLGLPRLSRRQNESKEESLAHAYGTLHWIIHLLNVEGIAKDAATTNLVVSFMKNHFLLWFDAMISEGLHTDAAVLMKTLERVLQEQAREEDDELPETLDFKHPEGDILEQLREEEQSDILSLVHDGVQVVRSHMSSNTFFHKSPNSVIFYPEESALKQDWMAKNKTWLGTPPRMTPSWSDNPLILYNRSRIQSIDFCPDGRLLASGSTSYGICVWDAEMGEVQLRDDVENRVHYVAFSPSGLLASVSENGVVSLWDLSTGHSSEALKVQRSQVTAIRFSPNGKESEKLVLATSEALLLWKFSNIREPTYTEDVIEEGVSVHAVDFSQQGTWIASGGKGGDVKIWDAQHGNALRRRLQGHEGDVTSIAFSRDGKLLVSGSNDSTAKIWSVETGANLKSFACVHGVYGVAFSPDGSLIAAGFGNQISVWGSESGVERYVIRGHKERVAAVAFSPRGCLASGSDDMTIRLWDLQGSVSNDAHTLLEPVGEKPINVIAMSLDGQFLASTSGESIHLWDGITGMPLEPHTLLQSLVQSISFSPDGKRLVSSSKDGIVRVWDVVSGILCRTFQGHSDWVRHAVFSPDGTSIASASDDRTVRIWSCPEEGEENDAKVLHDHNSKVTTVAFSPNGRLLVSGDVNSNMIIWDRKSLRPKHKVTGHSGGIIKLIFSQDSSRIVSRSNDCNVSIWDSKSGNLIQGPIKTRNPQHSVGFDPKIPEYILTEFGANPSTLGSSSFFTQQSLKGKRYGISAAGDWITWNGREIIPIPAMYKPRVSWVQGNIVAIGTKSGKVLLFRFSTEVEPPT